MIIKGKPRGNGAQLGRYLITPGKNERVQVVEVRGTVALDVPGAVREMDAVGACTRSAEPLYHASINTPAHERLTDEQRRIAVDRLEAELRFTGQPRVVVIHEKSGREHTHIVWSRTDLEHRRVIPISHNFAKHEKVARALEREFGHERVQGAHVEREGKQRPRRTPSHAEMLQAERTGLTPQQVKEQITDLWRTTDSGQAFAAALTDAGFVLARGDRRDFVVIDPRGGTHSLSRRVEGATAKDIRARMADLDASRLPTVAEAKEIQRERRSHDPARAQDAPREPESAAPRPSAGSGHEEKIERLRTVKDTAYAAEGAVKAIAAVADGIASFFESLIGGEDHKPQTPEERAAHARAQDEAAAARADAAAEAEQARKHAQSDPQKHRQQLLREFGRETDDEVRHDQDMERERGRSR